MRKKGKRERRSIDLNLILWLSFLLFAVLLIVIFTLMQNFQMNRQYREQIKKSLAKAGTEIRDTLTALDFSFKEAGHVMFTVANKYGVGAYLFTAGGEFVYPAIEGQVLAEYSEIFQSVREKYEASDRQESEGAPKPDNGIFIPTSDLAGYAVRVNLRDGAGGHKLYYIYCSASFELINSVSANMKWNSLVTALFAVALSFVASGFVSMIITKPVTEVTERAKQLARGNYEVRSHRPYFCTEVNELSGSLDYASSEISKTDKMQKELIANVSHDFKTPLTMIKAYAAMIGEISGDDPEKRQKHTQVIIDEADRLASLVKDVLDLSRLQSGIDNVERTVFNLTEDLYGVVGRFEYLAETQGYVFETDIDDDFYTYAGKPRVEQVLYNLIGNAVNYTGEDKKVVVRLKKREKGARFEVIDSGKGIPPEELDTIWERYYRSSEAHKRPVKGTGLGLSIVKNVLLRYGIPFGVTSEVGKGSCFWVDFPAPPDAAD